MTFLRRSIVCGVFCLTSLSVATPALCRSFWFKGLTTTDQQVTGIFDNNYGKACLKMGNTLLFGLFENGPPTNFERVKFRAYKAIRGNEPSRDNRVLTLKIQKASSKPTGDSVMPSAEVDELATRCDE